MLLYPTKIPMIVEQSGHSLASIEKKKFLTPSNLSISQFILVLRKRISLEQEKALFLYVGSNCMPRSTDTIGQLYQQFKDEDGFLYITYVGENTFGF